jgi:hypothetical protein
MLPFLFSFFHCDTENVPNGYHTQKMKNKKQIVSENKMPCLQTGISFYEIAAHGGLQILLDMRSSKDTPFHQGGFFEKIFFPSMYHDKVQFFFFCKCFRLAKYPWNRAFPKLSAPHFHLRWPPCSFGVTHSVSVA